MKGGKMQYLVLGLGRFGESVARNLFAMGRDVLAVDRDEGIIEDIAPFVTQAVQADAADEEALEALGAGDFDVAVVSTGDIGSSLLVSVLVREMGVKTVVAKALDELHARALKKVGVDRVVFPERETGLRIARALLSPHVVDLMELSPEHRIAQITLPERWAGHTLGELGVRRRFGLNILAIRRGEHFHVSPAADVLLRPGDGLLVLGKHEDIDGLEG